MVVNSHPLYQLSYRGRNPFPPHTARKPMVGRRYTKSPAPTPQDSTIPINGEHQKPWLTSGTREIGGCGGRSRNRTGVTGFAVPCITTMLSGPQCSACRHCQRRRRYRAQPRAGQPGLEGARIKRTLKHFVELGRRCTYIAGSASFGLSWAG